MTVRIMLSFDYFYSKEVIEQVIAKQDPPYRPKMPGLSDGEKSTNDLISRMVHECWDEDPDARPSFSDLKRQLRKINRGRWVELGWIIEFDSFLWVFTKHSVLWAGNELWPIHPHFCIEVNHPVYLISWISYLSLQEDKHSGQHDFQTWEICLKSWGDCQSKNSWIGWGKEENWHTAFQNAPTVSECSQLTEPWAMCLLSHRGAQWGIFYRVD